MAKNKSEGTAAGANVPQPQMQPQAQMPGAMPGMMPGMPGMMPGMPGIMPGMPGMGMQMNPMMQMMQMMQMMMGGGMTAPMIDPSAVPFAGQSAPDGDKGLDAEILRPALLTNRIKTQEAVSLGSVLDVLGLRLYGPL